ncbi:MAG: formate dehydrogenase accessory sulfurtransferase FdhD [Caldilineales bacterium]|nr:formate dehydrogenase accessory sulfurtransferase FdhD [Caldilineales bacterium]
MSDLLPKGALPASYHLYEQGEWKQIDAAIVAEAMLCIHVNGQELAAMMATPVDQEALALGFLWLEGFIDSMDEVEMVQVVGAGNCVDVWLRHEIKRPEREIKTSGCGGGVTFDDLTAARPPVAAETRVSPQQIIARYTDLRAIESIYQHTRGVHGSALCTPDAVLLAAEDVGRHNTLDKLAGKALQAGISTAGCLIVTTGRVSSEMLGKAARMGVPVVASRTSPTSRSLALAQAWNITLIGYVRTGGMRVYSHPRRLLPA